MRLKHYAATIFVALLAAFALSGAATVGASAAQAPAHVVTVQLDPAHVCDVRMVEWGVNAPGTDKPSNANAEFKRLFNPSATDTINVENWYVQDSFPHVYRLKGSALPAGSPFKAADGTFQMPPQSNVYVYNGTGTDGNPTNLTAALYSNLGHHHNNAGDTLSFRDLDGTAVDWVTYTPYRTRHAC